MMIQLQEPIARRRTRNWRRIVLVYAGGGKGKGVTDKKREEIREYARKEWARVRALQQLEGRR